MNLRRSTFNNAQTQYYTPTTHNFILNISLSHHSDERLTVGEGANLDNRAKTRGRGYYDRDGSSCVSPARVWTDSSGRWGKGEVGAGAVSPTGWEGSWAESISSGDRAMPRSAIVSSSRFYRD
ncbi:hypothetical protein MPER_01319 [Moniliophthora perniciosa FA553]|nr:hypothetical protein MPER_01319 [Moniliophthora perniciosa FA553]